MPRANRYHLPGYVWHITHRCHKKEFLLKFARDRRRWVHWLFEARKRYGLTVLNYMVISNHIHLLVADNLEPDGVARSMQLIAGRTGQEYNQRKKRQGAFWEDRYHATAVESGKHLRRCMTYIDLNMCRAGQVNHPCEWADCGYHAIQSPPRRYHVIDIERAAKLLECKDGDELARKQRTWINKALEEEHHTHRDAKWSDHLAVGDEHFIDQLSTRLGYRARFRKAELVDGQMVLRETRPPYRGHFAPKNGRLSTENTYLWNVSI